MIIAHLFNECLAYKNEREMYKIYNKEILITEDINEIENIIKFLIDTHLFEKI